MKFFDFPNSLSSRLVSIVVLVTAVIVFIFSWYSIRSHKNALIHLVKHNAYQLSATVKSSLISSMLKNNRNRIQRSVLTIGEQEGIKNLRIFNKAGKIIFASPQKDINTYVDSDSEICQSCHTNISFAKTKSLKKKIIISDWTKVFKDKDGKEYLAILNPILNEPSCWKGSCHIHKSSDKILGLLFITFNLETVKGRVVIAQSELFKFNLAAIISIAIALFILIKIVISSRLKRLMNATQIVSRGNLSYKLSLNSEDELGILAKSFNEMTQKLAQTQRKLFQADRLAYMGRLAASVAHEINNPLTGILTYSGFLLKRSKDEQLKSDFQVIVNEADRCRNIVRGLLDFARQIPSHKALTDIHQVIDSAISIVENQLSLGNIKVIKEYAENMPDLSVDNVQIQQVFINLFVNSADAIENQGGEITIKTSLETHGNVQLCIVQISDTGCGIVEEKFEEIFDPFYTTKDGKGIGLGLAVVWGIIEEHNGLISVESELGKGSKFSLRLPINQEG